MKLQTNYEEFLSLNYQTNNFEEGAELFINDLIAEAEIKIDSNSFNIVLDELKNSGFLDEFEVYEFWNEIESRFQTTNGTHKHDGKYAECLRSVNNNDVNDYLETKGIAGDMHWTVMVGGFKDYKHQNNELVQLIFILESYRTYMLDRTLYKNP